MVAKTILAGSGAFSTGVATRMVLAGSAALATIVAVGHYIIIIRKGNNVNKNRMSREDGWTKTYDTVAEIELLSSLLIHFFGHGDLVGDGNGGQGNQSKESLQNVKENDR